MDNLDNKIKDIAISYLSIPAELNGRVDNTLAQLERCKTKNKNILKKWIVRVISFIITSISITAFATSIRYYYIENSKNTLQVKGEIETNLFDNLDMIPYDDIDGLLYKVINNVDEYSLVKNIFDNVPSVDFEKEFLMVLDFNKGSINGIEVLEIFSDDNTLNIILGNDELNNDKGKTLCITISNQLYQDNLMIKLIPGSNAISKYGFTPMKNIQKDYINDKALQEDCLVMDGYNHIIYNSESDFLEFVNNCEKNINGAYRIVKEISSPELMDEYAFEVQDLIFENNKFYRFVALYKKNYTDKAYDFETYQNDGVEIIINPYDTVDKVQYC